MLTNSIFIILDSEWSNKNFTMMYVFVFFFVLLTLFGVITSIFDFNIFPDKNVNLVFSALNELFAYATKSH